MGNAVHVKSPLRLGLAGGGTDVSPYRNKYGGYVVNVTISLFAHCNLEITNRPTEFIAADYGCVDSYDENRVSLNQQRLDLHRAVHRKMVETYLSGKDPGLRMITYSDSPPGSGIGASSSLVVSMVAAYVKLFDIQITRHEIAQIAYTVERIDCGMSGGMQDQYAAAFGGFNVMRFNDDNDVIIEPINLPREIVNEFESRILLYYTGRSRTGAKIIEAQVANTLNGDMVTLNAMHDLKRSAVLMEKCLSRGDLKGALAALTNSWMHKKATAVGITNDHIDKIGAAAIEAGADGLKISGAGGGGFMIIVAAPHNRIGVIRALEPLGGQFYSVNTTVNGVESWKIRA